MGAKDFFPAYSPPFSRWLVLLSVLFYVQGSCAVVIGHDSLLRRNSTLLTTQEYRDRRADLIAEERALRFDTQRIRNATAKELRAVEIVDELRKREQASVWYADPNKEPGMPYLWAKDTIAQTDLFKLIKKMPKGGLLHAHLEAICDASYLLKLALDYPTIHVRTASSLNSSAPFPTPIFLPLSQAQANQYTNNSLPTSPEYQPNSWAAINRVRDGFPSELGGPLGFDKWIINSLTISAEDTYTQYNTTAKIWAKFTNTFIAAFGLVRYEPILQRYIDQLLVSQIEDGISYVEIRLGFSSTRGVISADGTRNLTNSQVMDLTQNVISGVRARLKEEGREDDFVGARVIYSATRSISYDEMVKQLNDCLALKEEFPELLAVGFDMAGQEEPGHPLIFFAEALLNFRAEAERRGLDIPFMFHAGETLDDGGEVDSNLYDAFLLGAQRVGHGFSLAKHPLLMQKYRENGIAVEVCPISNELLRLTRSANTHTLPILLNNGVPVALSSDDPAVFQNPGLSFDFYQVWFIPIEFLLQEKTYILAPTKAIVASDITNILSLGQLARQSLEHSSLNLTAKASALRLWEKRWDEFIDYIVASG
ncbi:Adenosine deaminase CECR1 [Ceratobasidium theobromae]|uniref:Adenosine deaminase n=1 Tax=Ceratobasidium theobromae TaxID=1582974 RepID=A0A5N5QC77_9AGAM|nr:Adenosine deaminase CECR1 [Ceratobasidium theobromae]